MPPPGVIDIGGGNGRSVLADPTREYVLGGPWGATAVGGLLLAEAYDEVIRQFGPRVYDLMQYDDAVASSLLLLKAGVLADGLRLSPAQQAAPDEVVSRRKRKAELTLSADVNDCCTRALDRLEGLDETLFQLMDSYAAGHALAEMVFEPVEDGPDRGRMLPSRFVVKPRWAWAFRVDAQMRVARIRAWTTEGWADVDREHFALMVHQPREGDPRGSSLLRASYGMWNLKLQTFPDFGEYLKKFASGSLVMKAGPDARDIVQTDATTGARKTYTVEQQLINAGKGFKNHSILALPNGTDAAIVHSQGTGEAFHHAYDRIDRAIFRSIILSTRPIMEAKHGSKADSESGMDLMGMAVGMARKPLIRAIQDDFLFRIVSLNWGPEIARRFTPNATFGVPDHVSPQLMAAFADAWQKGLFQPEQLAFLWSKLGVPVPDGWAQRLGQARALEQQQQAQAQAQTQAADGAGADGAGGAAPGAEAPTGDGGGKVGPDRQQARRKARGRVAGATAG